MRGDMRRGNFLCLPAPLSNVYFASFLITEPFLVRSNNPLSCGFVVQCKEGTRHTGENGAYGI